MGWTIVFEYGGMFGVLFVTFFVCVVVHENSDAPTGPRLAIRRKVKTLIGLPVIGIVLLIVWLNAGEGYSVPWGWCLLAAVPGMVLVGVWHRQGRPRPRRSAKLDAWHTKGNFRLLGSGQLLTDVPYVEMAGQQILVDPGPVNAACNQWEQMECRRQCWYYEHAMHGRRRWLTTLAANLWLMLPMSILYLLIVLTQVYWTYMHGTAWGAGRIVFFVFSSVCWALVASMLPDEQAPAWYVDRERPTPLDDAVEQARGRQRAAISQMW